jgi:ubiquinone/menaquinone biosynthesis C-methylase UbiE
VRPTYPPALFRKLADALGGRQAEAAVDVGCGSGQSLAGLFEIAGRVVGVEPADRLREAAAAAYPRATLLKGSGEDIPLPEASADLITVANAFYWMDMPVALAEVARVLRRPGGVFATYKYDFPKVQSTGADRVLRRHLGHHWDVHRSRKLTGYDATPDLMRACGHFASVVSSVVPYTLRYDAPRFVEFMSSTSYVQAHLETEADPKAYLDRFAAELEEQTKGEEFDMTLVLFVNVGVRG